MSISKKAGMTISFQSKLENWAAGMDYCALSVPARVTKSLGTKSAVLVMAQINKSEPFKVSLFPAGGGQHYIRVRAKIRKAAKLKEGDSVKVRITVLDRSDIAIPKDLATALRAERLTADFKRLTPGKKNYAIRRIDDAVQPGTRAKRIKETLKLAAEESGHGSKSRS